MASEPGDTPHHTSDLSTGGAQQHAGGTPHSRHHAGAQQQHHGGLPGQVKIRILGLHFNTYFKHADLEKILNGAYSFHMQFEPHHGTKMGQVSLTYESEASAKESFGTIHKLASSNHSIKVQAPRKFYEPYVQQMHQHTGAQSPTVCNDNVVLGVDPTHPDLHSILYAYNLLPNADEKFLRVIFESDVIASIKIDKDPKRSDGSKIALLFFTDESAMKQAQLEYDNFSVDDGDVSRPMRLVSLAAHFQNMRSGKAAKSSATPTWETTSAGGSTPQQTDETHRSPGAACASEPPPAAAAAVPVAPASLSLGQVCDTIDSVLESQRVNWAELHDAKDLWRILDEVSRRHGWVSDQQCREAMLRVLRKHRTAAEHSDWMPDVLDTLIKSWEREVDAAEQHATGEGDGVRPPARSDRQYVLSAPAYSPPSGDAPKPKRGGQKKGRRLLGVGALLSSAREAASNDERSAENSPRHAAHTAADAAATCDTSNGDDRQQTAAVVVDAPKKQANEPARKRDKPKAQRQKARPAHKSPPPEIAEEKPPTKAELEDGEMAESDEEGGGGQSSTARAGRPGAASASAKGATGAKKPLPPRHKRKPPSSSESSSDDDSDDSSSSAGGGTARNKRSKKAKKKAPSSDSSSSGSDDDKSAKPGMEAVMPQMMAAMMAQLAGAGAQATPEQQAAMQGIMQMASGAQQQPKGSQAHRAQQSAGYNYFVKSSQH